MEPLAAEPRLRHRDRGLEKREIPDARIAAVARDLIGVQRKNLVQRKERWVHSASRLNTPAYFRCACSTTLRSLAERFGDGTGETTSTRPSVDTSSSVSPSMFASSSNALSRTSARLLPVRTSFLRMVRTD